MQIIVSLLIGGLVGWLASKIMHSKGGLLRNILVGIVGGALGGWWAASSASHPPAGSPAS